MTFTALPKGASGLTASPWDDFESDAAWVDLAELRVSTGVAAFWHCVEAWTYERHFNRNIWRVDFLEDAYCKLDGSACSRPAADTEACVPRLSQPPDRDPTPRSRALPGPPRAGRRWVALRELHRKAPAPVGGGEEGRDKSLTALEWTTHYVAPSTGWHTAVFALVVPEGARKDNNPRALTFWPFQYPKVRALKVSFEPCASGAGRGPEDDATECTDRQCTAKEVGGVLRYSVLPLETGESAEGRDFGTIKVHASKAAMQLLNEVRKRAERFDPVAGVSTYVKRVEHDRYVPEALYRAHFRRLKEKYGYHWVSNWPEVTDPVKFVYEELSIAAYLIALFELERKEGAPKQSFADLGCGNGFLTYVLLEEGFSGYGVDKQKRGIWDLYPSRVAECLKLEALDPATYTCPDVDWIIGNHSDELTPFLPVICARSQRSSVARKEGVISPQFFVIPCCFYDFDERKYAAGFKQRTFSVQDTGQGRYAMYLSYIEKICTGLGFTVERENLRIPSTKYVALMGRFLKFPERATADAISQTVAVALDDARRSHAK